MSEFIGLVALGVAVFGLSYQYNKKFLDWLRFQSVGTRDYIVEQLALMFIEVTPSRVLAVLSGFVLVPFTLVFLAFLPNVVPGVLFGAIAGGAGWLAPKPIVKWFHKRRTGRLVLQMIDGLSLMSNGLKSGLSIVQSLGLVATEMANPIQQEFNLILSENKLGVPLEEAFSNFARRVPSDDVQMFVTSVNILKETGGNLAETFDTIVGTIRDRVKVENKISALTAQGFYQGIVVMLVPPIMGVILYQSDPEFMSPLFTTVIGWLVLLVIILLEAIGLFVIIRIMKVDV